MSETPALERLLMRDRAITLSGVALLCVLAWVYVITGAGMGMPAWEMTTASLFPHTAAAPPQETMPEMEGMPGMEGMAMEGQPTPAWSVATWGLLVAMWWVMMIAMMAPSATPTILLYARAYRHAAAQGTIESNLAPTGAFTAGYLLVWLAFSVAAASLQGVLVQVDLVSDMTMGSQSRWFSGGLLIAAGLYQLSPLKSLCLENCRSPTQFLTQHWRPGAAGAIRLGIIHGAYCVGCCWVLMALLFVGGVMNLIWIAALAVLVLAEKLAPGGPWLGRGIGVALVAWGVATFLV
ncbi:MAG: DUF2182 domain-containing protein [Caulobacteraceae bacterium]